jgi:membrane protease subunit (stomatin/prohibitin family)
MAVLRKVISTLLPDGTDIMGPRILAWKYNDASIISGSLLTVESNHFAVLKSRGAVLGVYDTGQYPIVTPDKPLLGSFISDFFGGTSPWQYETIFLQRSKLRIHSEGSATTSEMADMVYQADYYVHIDTKDDALKLVTHVPFDGDAVTIEELAAFAGPVIEQAINQIVQVTPMASINEHINDIVELCKAKLNVFLGNIGVHLNDLKILITPKNERMRELITFKALGLDSMDCIRAYLALKMAEKGLVSAPNAMVGQPFNIGQGTLGTWDANKMVELGTK